MASDDDIQRVPLTREQTRAFYDRISRYYDRLTSLFEAGPRNRALDLAQVRPGERVLEVGCGPGQALERMAQQVGEGGRVVGLDLSPGMLRVAGSRLERAGVRRRADLVNSDATRLPFAEGSFDLVFSSFTLELLDTPDIPEMLAEVKRVLTEEGRFVDISLSRENRGRATALYEWLHQRFPRFIDCRPIYLRRALARAGFSIVETHQVSLAGLGGEIVSALKTQRPQPY